MSGPQDARVEGILTLATRIASGDLHARGAISPTGDMLDAITAALNTLAEELAASNKARDALERRLAYRAAHDGLTDLPNRELFGERLATELRLQREGNGRVGLLFVDLDDFKDVNDTHGHHVGDLLLTAVGRRIHDSLRGGDLAARLGGDEFAIVAAVRSPVEAELVGARMIEALREPFHIDDHEIRVHASVGIAMSAPDDTPESILQHADRAMYAAKRSGKDRFVTYAAELMVKEA